MWQFERFVTECNEKADELAKAAAMMDEGFMAEARAEKLCSREERKCTQLCSMRRLEQMGTKEFSNMMQRIQTLEEGRVPAKKAKNWRIE